MNKSESIASLSKALVIAQSQFKHVPMNSTNPFYKSKYADLGAVIESSKAILKDNGLAVSQLVEGESGQVGITTILIHESGEFISSTVSIPVEGNNIAQESGKAITYLRRYGLASILGMYADEDTDAHKEERSITDEAKKLGAVEKKKNPPVPLDNVPQMSLDLAQSVMTSKMKKYGDCDNEELRFMFNSILEREPTEETALKKTAIQTILLSRQAK